MARRSVSEIEDRLKTAIDDQKETVESYRISAAKAHDEWQRAKDKRDVLIETLQMIEEPVAGNGEGEQE